MPTTKIQDVVFNSHLRADFSPWTSCYTVFGEAVSCSSVRDAVCSSHIVVYIAEASGCVTNIPSFLVIMHISGTIHCSN